MHPKGTAYHIPHPVHRTTRACNMTRAFPYVRRWSRRRASRLTPHARHGRGWPSRNGVLAPVTANAVRSTSRDQVPCCTMRGVAGRFMIGLTRPRRRERTRTRGAATCSGARRFCESNDHLLMGVARYHADAGISSANSLYPVGSTSPAGIPPSLGYQYSNVYSPVLSGSPAFPGTSGYYSTSPPVHFSSDIKPRLTTM